MATHRPQDPGPHSGDPTPPPSLGERIARIAERIAHLDPGSTAALRRGPRAGAGAAAFWQIMASHAPEGLGRNEAGWAAVLQAIAILTPKGTDADRQSAHTPAVPMGAALRDASVTELRLAALLNARAAKRAEHAVRLCRRLARTEQRRFDLRTLARFILYGTDDTARRIAREYYSHAHSDANRESITTRRQEASADA